MIETQPALPEQTRRRRRRMILLAAIAVSVLIVGWWLASPLFLDRVVDEEFPVATPAVVEPQDDEVGAADQPSAAPAPESGVATRGVESSAAESSTADTPAGPVLLRAGNFAGADSAHQGSGSASLYDVDGEPVLRFEDFEVTNGPDLRVNLVLMDGSMVDLGELTGNIGDQNYDIPTDLDLSSVESVLIYCRAFSVPFAEAVLA